MGQKVILRQTRRNKQGAKSENQKAESRRQKAEGRKQKAEGFIIYLQFILSILLILSKSFSNPIVRACSDV